MVMVMVMVSVMVVASVTVVSMVVVELGLGFMVVDMVVELPPLAMLKPASFPGELETSRNCTALKMEKLNQTGIKHSCKVLFLSNKNTIAFRHL